MTLELSRLSRLCAGAVGTLVALVLATPAPAAAFCGFYVTGADASLYANATMVVLMRDGTRTVLSMQNNYQGPPEAFALVIPVPAVLQKEQVKVLPKDVFQKVDALAAPRLVEYWEDDPCRVITPVAPGVAFGAMAASSAAGSAAPAAPPAVRIEAQFAVGEYDVVILSADDSSALDGWLRENKYNIPDGAAPVLAPYVASGMKFFVAKVDPARVTFKDNQAALSPLRFYYDTPDFSLPVRLGLLNSQGSQDLIVHILAQQRYELANYPNVTIPTNIRVQNAVRNDFGSFYEALFSRATEKNPRAVVTEYSWAASSCDPCPTPPLSPTEIATLGGDVLQQQIGGQPQGAAGGAATLPAPAAAPTYNGFANGFTLTRLHARYTKDMLGEDLVFQQAPGITGGRGIPDTRGVLDQSVQQQGGYNDFQGRYVILHPWEGALACQSPRRGQWGGPPGGNQPKPQAASNAALMGAPASAGDLSALLAESIPSLAVTAKTPLEPLAAIGGRGGSGQAGRSGAGGAGAAANAGAAAGATSTGNAAAGATSAGNAAIGGTPSSAGGSVAPVPAKRTSGGCSVGASDAHSPFELAIVAVGLALYSVRRRRVARRQGDC